MNIVDLLLGVIILSSVVTGYSRGFIYGLTSFLAWIGSLVIGLALFNQSTTLMGRFFPALGTWVAPVSLLIPVMLAHLLLTAISGAFLRQVDPHAHQSGLNKALGMLPGLIRGWLLATLLAAMLVAFPVSGLLRDAARASRIAGSLTRQAGWLESNLAPEIREALGKAVVRLPGPISTEESFDLSFKVTNPVPRTDLEARMLVLVNAERIKAGLQPLRADLQLLPVARAHSKDMFAKGYFAHIDPDGKTPADRIRQARVPFLTAGENLALGPTLSRCHRGLMESPGHRANILNPAFGRVGIAVLDGGYYGLMITQNFRN